MSVRAKGRLRSGGASSYFGLLFSGGQDGAVYNIQNLGTLWEDTSATTPASVGGLVARIDPIAGNSARYLRQSSTLLQATLRLHANGFYYLEMSGARYVDSGAYTLDIAAGNYVGWVGAINATGTNNVFGVSFGTGDNHVLTHRGSGNFIAGQTRMAAGAVVVVEKSLPPDGATFGTFCVADSQVVAGTTDAGLNKGRSTSSNALTTETRVNSLICLGAVNAASGTGGNAYFCGGVVVNSTLSTETRARVQDELARLIGNVLAPGWGHTVTSVTAATTQTLVDAHNSDVGKGFSCTGISKFMSTGDTNALWIGNHGQNKQVGGGTKQPTLCKVSLDGTSLLSEIDLYTLFSGSESVQGVACDETDGTIWVAIPTTNRVEHVTTAGADVGNGFAFTGANGLAYDHLRNKLWVSKSGTSERTLSLVTKAGVVDRTITVELPLNYLIDQIWHDRTRDVIWMATELGTVGRIYGISPADGSRVYEYRPSNALETEGILVDGTTVYLTSDEYYHNSGRLLNTLYTYTIS